MAYAYLAIAILAEVIGTSVLKATQGFSSLVPSLIAIVAYVVGLVFLSLALRTLNIGIANAVWSGCGIVLISLAGSFFYGQRLDPAALLGLGLIIAGVLVVQVFSSAAA